MQRIKELWLDTKHIPEDHENVDMTDIFAKFEHLKSLHLITPSVNFDAKHLFSVCKNLNDLRIQRNNNNEAVSSQ